MRPYLIFRPCTTYCFMYMSCFCTCTLKCMRCPVIFLLTALAIYIKWKTYSLHKFLILYFIFYFYSFLQICSYKVFVCILFFTLAMMMNIPSLHMMNIIPSTDSILSTSSTSPALDQMVVAAARPPSARLHPRLSHQRRRRKRSLL